MTAKIIVLAAYRTAPGVEPRPIEVPETLPPQIWTAAWKAADAAVRRLNVELHRLPAERFRVGRVHRDTDQLRADAYRIYTLAGNVCGALETFSDAWERYDAWNKRCAERQRL